MNPSASGWIDKYVFDLNQSKQPFPFADESDFYLKLRSVGFVYGHSIELVFLETKLPLHLTPAEKTKANLLYSLFYFYFQKYPENTFDNGINDILLFYKKIIYEKKDFFRGMGFKTSESNALEKIIENRISFKSGSLEKNPYEKLVTHALLFTDVLTYKRHLHRESAVEKFHIDMQKFVVHNCFFALLSKSNKTKHDKKFIDTFDGTVLSSEDEKNYETEFLQSITAKIEKWYLLDLSILSVYNDLMFKSSEKDFLYTFSEKLRLTASDVDNFVEEFILFVETRKIVPTVFIYKNPVKDFYNESSRTVTRLILRNKNRLVKELSQSGDLLVLLGKSTVVPLEPDEKNKVKEQLLSICKSIPSLTIFLLPGGSVLLPILIKFIPQLLPDAFDENKIPKK